MTLRHYIESSESRSSSPDLRDILRARRRLAGRVVRTPLLESAWLSSLAAPTGRVFLKLESLQTTGSFKLRGALNATLALLERRGGPLCPPGGGQPQGVAPTLPDDPPRLVTASAANHGRALAYAAEQLALCATIFTPKNAPRVKLDAIRRHGADLRADADGYEETERLAKAYAVETGAIFISPYNDPDVIAGAGTVGLEIIEELPDLEVVVVPVGGGGLISGVATAIRTIAPKAEIIGVEAAASPAFHTSLREGRIAEVDVRPTIADGLAGNMDPDSITFDMVRRLVDRIELVTEDEMKTGIRELLAHEPLIAEGAGVAALAAVLAGKVKTLARKTAIVVS